MPRLTTNQQNHLALLPHGGRLQAAAKQYDIPLEEWQDLSTGVSPWSWPVPATIPNAVWHKLRENESLIARAAQYYQCSEASCLPVAGSQVAIRLLPQLLPITTVAVPGIGYQEHRYSWQLAGHECFEYSTFEELLALVRDGHVENAVVVNPNNPTTEFFPAAQLALLSNELHKKAGDNAVLIVDEAFADPRPTSDSVIASQLANTIVLRSLGKFFGLAGLRLGFVITEHPLLSTLRTMVEPWSVSAPAVYLGALALKDARWQAMQRSRIAEAAQQLGTLCEQRFPNSDTHQGDLFVTVFDRADTVKTVFESAANSGVLLRYDTSNASRAWLRIGLADDGYARLAEHWGDNSFS
ncbi:MAG: threonine-phosphate decarboxylase [Pseudomonadota bacterium]